MKRVIFGLVIFFMGILGVSAKDKSLVQIKLINGSDNLKVNLTAYNENGSNGLESYKDGYYFLSDKALVSAKDNVYTYEVSEENTKFQFVTNNGKTIFSSGIFKCKFIKDIDDNNICYQEVDMKEKLTISYMNIHILLNSLDILKNNVISFVLITIVLIIIALIYNKVIKIKTGISLVNSDIFFIAFNIALLIMGIVLYVANFFNVYNLMVLLSVIMIIYYFLYYLVKVLGSKDAGKIAFGCGVIAYLLALSSSLLILHIFM